MLIFDQSAKEIKWVATAGDDIVFPATFQSPPGTPISIVGWTLTTTVKDSAGVVLDTLTIGDGITLGGIGEAEYHIPGSVTSGRGGKCIYFDTEAINTNNHKRTFAIVKVQINKK